MKKFEPSLEAKAQGVCCTKEEADIAYYRDLDPALRIEALNMLRVELSKGENPLAHVRKLIKQYGRDDWLWHFYDEQVGKLSEEDKQYAFLAYNPHHGWGMAVRNLLREKGFGEEELGVHNLDCCYIKLVTDAALLGEENGL